MTISGEAKPTAPPAADSDSTKTSLPADTKVFLGGPSDEARAVKFFCSEAGILDCVVDVDSNGGSAVPSVAEGHRLGSPGDFPLLQAGDVLLSQSHAILRHLANLLKSHMYPSDNAAAMAKVESVLEWRLTSLLPVVGRALSSAGKSSEATQGEMGRVLAHAEGWLAASPGKYMTGRGLTIADIVVASTLAQLETGGVPLAKECPAVATWFANVKSRPHWQTSA